MQIALDLNEDEHERFRRWLVSTAVVVDPDRPRLDAGEAIRAMIRVCLRYEDITGQVASQLRHERASDRARP